MPDLSSVPNTSMGRRSRLGRAIGAGASGAMTGLALGGQIGAVGGPVGAAIGAGIGLLAGALSESPEEERERRIAMYRARLSQLKQEALTTAVENVNQATNAMQRRMTSGAERRAIAAGRTGDIEEVTAPIAAEIGNRGVGVRTQALQDVETRYNDAMLAAEQDIYSAPIEPTAVDYLQAIGPAAIDYAGMMQRGRLNERMLNQQQQDQQFYRDLYEREFGRGRTDTGLPVNNPSAGASTAGLMLPEATTITPMGEQEIPYQYDLQNPRNRRNLLRRLG